jgi:uncharacterized protein (DUF2062 family)
MILAQALAALVRANKAVAIPMVWLTNPLTNVPVYGFGYAFGHFLLTGTWVVDPKLMQGMTELMTATIGFDFYHAAYWSTFFNLLLQVGIDLWLGTVVLGLLSALITYPLMYRIVIKCRALKKTKLSSDDSKSESMSMNVNMDANEVTVESDLPPQNKHHAA